MARTVTILGLVILVVDLLWLYGSVTGPSMLVGGNGFYRNSTAAPNFTRPGFNSSAMLPGARSYGDLDLIYGVVILVADVALIYLSYSKPEPAKKKSKQQ